MLITLVTILIFSALLIGGGVFTQWALRLSYLGLAMTLFWGGWLVIALAYAMPVRWSAWVGEMAFGVVILIVWGLHQRGIGFDQRGESSPYRVFDLAMIAVILLAMSVPALVLPVPLDTDAQGFGYLALTARLSGDLTRLAPLNPDLAYLYAPGFTVIVAYLSERLGAPLHSVQFAAGAVLVATVALVLYDFAHLLGGQKRARGTLIALFIGTGLFTAYMDSHYTSVIGLVFGVGFLAFAYRYLRNHQPADGVGASINLAALVLVHPDTTIIVGLGYGAWLLLMPLAKPRPSWRIWGILVGIVPLVALVMVLPWLLSVAHLLGGDITSPFERFPHYWRVILSVPPEILYHGGVTVIIAGIGAVIGLQQRDHGALLSVGWLILILEFAAFGLLERLAPLLVAPIVRYDYPFSIAWHGPIVPYALLAGIALSMIPIPKVLNRDGVRSGVLITVTVGVVLAGVFHQELLALSKGRVTLFGAFASHADVEAMGWLRANTKSDAYVLNFPGPQEGDWVPVIAERRSVYYRPQPFFTREGDPLADTDEQIAFRAFWENPADSDHATLLHTAGIDYVIVPQVVGNPESFDSHVRWRRPFTDLIMMQSAVSEAPYLELVFDADGAEVYRVLRE